MLPNPPGNLPPIPGKKQKKKWAERSEQEKRVVIGLCVLFGIILIIGAIVGGTSSKSSNTSGSSSTSAEKSNSSTKNSSTSGSTDYTYSAATGVASKTITENSFWDENDVVRTAYENLVKVGEKAFAETAATAVTITVRTSFKDTYGKSALEDAVIITMDKTEFQKFNWDGLAYQPVSAQIEIHCSRYYVHPAIENATDPDKLYLVK